MTKARQLADLISSGSIETAEITSLDAAKLTGNIADARVPASAVTQHANNYTHPNHSGEVTSTADGATVITDNIVDEANLKVSNTPTNGYMLTAQSGNTGGLTWAEAGGGGLEFLTKTNIGSDTSEVEFTGINNTGGGSIRIVYNGIKTSSSNGVDLRFVVGDASSYRTGSSTYNAAHQYNQVDGSGNGHEQQTAGYFRWVDNIAIDAGGGLGGFIDIFGFADGAHYKWVNFALAHRRKAGGYYSKRGGGWLNTDAAFDRIKFITSAGDYAAGEFMIYRWKES